MLHHLSIGVTDLGRAGVFYDAVLQPLGFIRVWADSSAIGYGECGKEDAFAIKLRAHARAPGPGFHLAFSAASQAQVHSSYAAGIENGGRDNGAPGIRPHYGPAYYAGYLIDPDGHQIEIVMNPGR